MLRPLLQWPVAQRVLTKGETSSAALYVPCNQPQQTGFSRTVGTSQGKDTAGLQGEINILQQCIAPGRSADRTQCQRAHDCIP